MVAWFALPTRDPIVDPRLNERGALEFENAAVAAGFASPPASYQAVWSRYDNATGAATRIGESRGQTPSLQAPGGLPDAAGSFVQVEISAEVAEHPAWRQPVRVFFRRQPTGWKLVGLERLPGNEK